MTRFTSLVQKQGAIEVEQISGHPPGEEVEEGPSLPADLVERGSVLLLFADQSQVCAEEAKQAFEAALELEEAYVPALLALGWFCLTQGDDPARARALFDQAFELSRETMTEALAGRVASIVRSASEEEGLAEARRWFETGALIAREKLSPGLLARFPK